MVTWKVSVLAFGATLAFPAAAKALICRADPTRRLSIDSAGSVFVDIDGLVLSRSARCHPTETASPKRRAMAGTARF